MLRHASLVTLSACLVMSLSRTARSDTSSDRLGAEALAEEAATLMSAGQYEKGCKKYEEAALLDESPTRLLTLAACHERRGKVASAWATLSEAAEVADARGDARSAASARESQKRLEPHIGRLKVVVPDEAQVDDLVISRDGVPLSYSLWGLPVAVDPGPHVIRVTAPGRQSWQVEVGLMPGKGTVVLQVPPLAVDPESARFDRERFLLERREGPISSSEPSTTRAAETPSFDESAGRAQRTVGIVLAGAGVVSLALGTGFALAAHRSNDDLDKICAGNTCPVEAVDLVDQERAQAARANIALGLGALALAGGAVVYFTAPTSRSPKTGRVSASARQSSDGGWGLSTAIAPGTAALVAAGRF
jgi:hypothetical protein